MAIRDRNGRTIIDGDRVVFQYGANGPRHEGVVDDADSHRARELNAVRVSFADDGGGYPQYIGGEHLAVV